MYSFFDNINLLVLGSVALAILLSIMLVIVVFTIKFKSQHEIINQLQYTLDDKIEKMNMLDENLSEIKALNASYLQKLNQCEERESKLYKEIDISIEKLKESNEKIDMLSSQIVSLEKDKSEFGANVKNAKQRVVELEDALANATKRNEFWVEQMTEVRTKYEALKLKMRKG